VNTVEVNINIVPYNPADAEILIAVLLSAGFESFVEHEKGLLAYIRSADFDQDVLESALSSLPGGKHHFPCELAILEQKNWNEAWEKNYDPVIVDNRVLIKAPFHHDLPAFQYVITLEPKMAFGTGHHETTSLMIASMLQFHLKNATVLDMGCGTGVLAILSAMMGAEKVYAVDMDDWAIQNARENCLVNGQSQIIVMQGDRVILPDVGFDLILANINLNVLLADMPVYFDKLRKNGRILLSGIYQQDFLSLKARALQCGFSFEQKREKKAWVAASFLK
jgi:ribosomal protein L11 methyltransferase